MAHLFEQQYLAARPIVPSITDITDQENCGPGGIYDVDHPNDKRYQHHRQREIKRQADPCSK
jgi:hypothetical protein